MIPQHLQKYPCMKPRIGSNYNSGKHRRLLIMGESHYLPLKSTIHKVDSNWYNNISTRLSELEKTWVSIEAIIANSLKEKFKNKAHSIYRNIAWELNEIGLKLENYCNAIEHIAFYNYFQRPAIEGDSLIVTNQDILVANEVLDWFIKEYSPELVIITSSLAGQRAKSVLENKSIPFVITPHPGCHWWNRTAKKYNGCRGRDLFTNFLVKNRWLR